MDRLFRAYLKAVGLGWVLEEELFKNAPVMNHEGREALRDLILNKMQERTLAEWMEGLYRRRQYRRGAVPLCRRRDEA